MVRVPVLLGLGSLVVQTANQLCSRPKKTNKKHLGCIKRNGMEWNNGIKRSTEDKYAYFCAYACHGESVDGFSIYFNADIGLLSMLHHIGVIQCLRATKLPHTKPQIKI